jgi:hypothetical protein
LKGGDVVKDYNQSKDYEDYIKNKGEKRSNPLNKSFEKEESSDKLKSILEEIANKNKG